MCHEEVEENLTTQESAGPAHWITWQSGRTSVSWINGQPYLKCESGIGSYFALSNFRQLLGDVLLGGSPDVNVVTLGIGKVARNGLRGTYERTKHLILAQGLQTHIHTHVKSCTFLKPLVRFIPDPWMSMGWKKTVSPASISKWTRGMEGSKSTIPWYILFTPP